ncbi:hypothetical protein NLX67_14255 [Domibacillus sp. A3M-37]|jgi:hypothetical protein|uniref:hypothetical protein n=1 Tax=Domibacillus TaxID=1433999 RepID=UPI000617D38D|nr:MULTISPECIES: hypothetical protein [Domibacillus]MCP3763540.1 hypothetical protein [Domibacillus sp. A3M-37]
MNFAIGLVVLILLCAVGGTLFVMKSEDAKYGESTKRNTMNLTIIYAITFFLLAVGTVWFIVSATS